MSETINGKRVLDMFFVYWIILLILQASETLFGTNGNNALIKIALMCYLTFTFLRNGRGGNQGNSTAFFALFFVAILITFLFDSNRSFSIIVAYAFPCLFVFLTYCVGGSIIVSKKDYSIFLDRIISTVYIMILYCIIFTPDRIFNFLSITNAYASCLTSFFVNNHEYAMYLVFGIVACFIQMATGLGKHSKLVYIVSVLIMVVNLILTYSRTSLVAFLGFLIITILFSNNRKFKIFTILSVVVFTIAVLNSSSLLSFINNFVIRADTNSRTELWNEAIQVFRNSSFWQKLFGQGISNGRMVLNAKIGHQGAHNAYIQVLVTHGFVTLLYMVFFLISSVIDRIRCIRLEPLWGAYFLGMVISALLFMFTNTPILFYSPIDSMMMTTFIFVVPKYVINGLYCGASSDSTICYGKDSY